MPFLLTLLELLGGFGGSALGRAGIARLLPAILGSGSRAAGVARTIPGIARAGEALSGVGAKQIAGRGIGNILKKALVGGNLRGGINAAGQSVPPSLGGIAGVAAEIGGFVGGSELVGGVASSLLGDQTEDEISQAPQRQRFIEPSQQSQLGQIQQEAALRQALSQFGIDFDDLVNNADNLGGTGGLF